MARLNCQKAGGLVETQAFQEQGIEATAVHGAVFFSFS